MKVPRILIGIAAMLVMSGSSVVAQGVDRVRIDVAAVGESGVSALAFLTRTEDGTSVVAQLNTLTTDSPSGAIRSGTCADLGDPVELLGFVDGTGILDRTVGSSLESLADGTHILVLHAGGLDSPPIACGPIPGLEAVNLVEPVEPVDVIEPVAPVETVQPVDVIEPAQPVETVQPVEPVEPVEPVGPVEPVEPIQPVDAECGPITAWTSVTNQRLDRFDELGKLADKAAESGDFGVYSQAVNQNLAELGSILQDMRAESVPSSLVEVDARLIANLDEIGQVAIAQLDAIAAGDQATFDALVTRSQELVRAYQALRGEIRAIDQRCGTTA